MAAFTPLFDIVQSSDGLVGTISDTSNYADNDDNIVAGDFSDRSVTILDSDGDVYTVVTFDGDDLEATFDIDNINLWANATMDWTGINPVADYTKHLQFGLGRVTENDFSNILQLGCCSDAVAENALTQATNYLQDGSYAEISGNAAMWQKDYDSARKYLRQVYNFSRVSAGS